MALKDIIKGIGSFIPGAELAKGLGFTFGMSNAYRLQEEADKRQRELDEQLKKRLKDPTTTADEKNRLVKAARNAGRYNIIEDVVSEAPTSKQVIASAAELAAVATMGFKPKLPTGATFKYAGDIVRAQRLIKTAETAAKVKQMTTVGKIGFKAGKLALTTVKEAAIGGGWFGLSELASNKDATTNDIVKAAETGALVGGGTVLGMAGLGLVAKGVGKVVGQPIKRAIGKAIIGIEKVAAGAEKPLAEGASQVEKTLSYIGEAKTPLKQKIAKATMAGLEFMRKTESRLIDRFSPLKRIERRLVELNPGKPLQEYQKVYRDARLLQAVSDARAEQKVTELIDKLNPYKDVNKESKAYITQLDFIDRSRLGQTVAGGQTKEQLTRGLFNMVKEMGPEKAKRVGQVRQIIRDYNIGLLKERVDAGVISQELMDKLIATHPNYIPHNVMMDIEERTIQGLSQSLNVPRTDIMKAFGSVRNIQDPIEATIQRTSITTRLIEKNKLLNNLVRVQEETGAFPGMKLMYTGSEAGLKGEQIIAKSPLGYDNITLFRNGVKQVWQVPGDIAVAIKNLDAQLTPTWFKILTTPQRLLKKFATQYNLSFTLPNKFRDKQTAYLTARGFIEDLAQRYGATTEKVLPENWKELYKISGGYGASIFKEGEGKILNDLSKTGMVENIPSWLNPAKIIDKVNDAVEKSTRLEVFKMGLKRGLSLKDAAFASREATIDFAKMGTWMKPLNQAVPFLNARVQGFINLPRAFVNNPEVFARMQLYTAVYPTIALHQHNRRFESYKNISQYMKNKYWVIMTGETDGIDSYTGDPIKIPQFITVPKGEGQTLVSGPIQYFLDKNDGTDFRTTSQMIADVIGSASPLEFQTFNRTNFAATTISQFGPLAKIGVGWATGKDVYTGQPIVPESRQNAPKEMQFTRTTPETTKALANIIGISPLQLKFVLDSFGGVPQDLQNAIEIVYNVVKNGRLGGHSLSDTPFGALTQIPLTRRFLREAGEYGSPEQQFREQQKTKLETEITGEKLKVKDKATQIWEEMNKKETKDERLNYLNSLGGELTNEIKEQIKTMKESRNTVEALKKSDSVELRARYIMQRMFEITSKEERVKYLNNLEKEKILTDAVRKRIAELKVGQ